MALEGREATRVWLAYTDFGPTVFTVYVWLDGVWDFWCELGEVLKVPEHVESFRVKVEKHLEEMAAMGPHTVAPDAPICWAPRASTPFSRPYE